MKLLNETGLVAGHPCEILLGAGSPEDFSARLQSAFPGLCRAVFVCDEALPDLWKEGSAHCLREAGAETTVYPLPAGDAAKTPERYLALLNTLAEHRLCRSDAVIAVGGGSVCDLAGFAAATYLRGCGYAVLPTTLLAMADAAVGGKTAVDLPAGKNLAGAFYMPRLVYCAVETLKTLPGPVFAEGCAELVKYGVLCDAQLLQTLLFKGTEFDPLAVLETAIAAKLRYVEKDERDCGERRFLNLGHTVGHAVETLSAYTVSHGRAVSIGLSVIVRASAAAGICGREDASDVLRTLGRLGLPTECPYDAKSLASAIQLDKKRSGTNVTLVLPERIGSCRLYPLPESELAAFLAPGVSEWT